MATSKKKSKYTISEDDIGNLARQLLDDSKSHIENVRSEQEKAIDYYNQELLGNESADRSRVVTADVRDTVEWILPMLMEMFVSGAKPVEFIPVGSPDPEQSKKDVDQARLETDYCHNVLFEQNDGFNIIYGMFKDALLTKYGVAKAYWDDSVEKEREEYKNITQEEFARLMLDDDVEIIEHTSYIDGQEEDGAVLPDQVQQAFGMGVTTHDVVVERQEDVSGARIMLVPPEKFYVNTSHNSINLEHAEFTAHETVATWAELSADGVPDELLEEFPSIDGDDDDQVGQARSIAVGSTDFDEGSGDTEEYSKASRKFRVYECYFRCDKAGDGELRMHKVRLCGDDGGNVIDIEEVDRNPFHAITPVIMTHRFYGLSVADMVMDIQEIRTTLMRQILDNLYLTNTPQKLVVDGIVNLDDLLTPRPGGIVRAKSLQGLQELTVPFVAAESLPILALLDDMREQRTGVSKTTQGLDPSALANSTNLVGTMISNASMGRIKMIARVFAETGFRSMMLHLRELMVKNAKRPDMMAMASGDFVTVDPREWRKKRRTRVNVGVGIADRNEKIVAMQNVISMQEKIFAAGGMGSLLMPENVYTAVTDFARLLGIHDGTKYFTDPTKVPPQQDEPDAANKLVEVEQAKVLAETNDKAAKNELEKMRLQLELKKHNDSTSIDVKELQLDARDIELKRQEHLLAITKQEHQEVMDAQKIAAELLKLQNEAADSQIRTIHSAVGELYKVVERMQKEQKAPRRVVRDKDGNITQLEVVAE